jgi:hypothetical protein
MRPIFYQNWLIIQPNNKIMVPGCEPESAISVPTLMSQMRQGGFCTGGCLVDLQDALDAIPGSRVEFLNNFNIYSHSIFRFPPTNLDCPCATMDDYYNILRGLARSSPSDSEREILQPTDNSRNEAIDRAFPLAPLTGANG